MISALPVSGAWVPNTIGAQLDRPRISFMQRQLQLAEPLAAELGAEVGRPEAAVADLLLERIDAPAGARRRGA